MQEVLPVQQIEGEPRRRWFYAEDDDLNIWFSPSEDPIGFQLCYRNSENEQALTWFAGRGFMHSKVDAGNSELSSMGGTPILRPGGVVDIAALRQRFTQVATELPSDLYRFVEQVLRAYPHSPAS